MIFQIDGKDIYYEIYGSGKPLIILNGIMMSTYSWKNFIENLSQNHSLVLIDFYGQGQSFKPDYQITHQMQVDLIEDLRLHLGYEKIDIFGISYGGEIGLQYAIQHPNFVGKLCVSNTCAYTSYWLYEVGNSWNNVSDNPLAYYYATIPYIYSPQFFEENRDWIENRKAILAEVFSDKDFMSNMVNLTNSSVSYDVRDRLSEITAQTLIISSEYDFVTPSYQQVELNQKIKGSSLVKIPDAGHALMYEKPDLFLQILLGFFTSNKVDEIV